MKLTRFTEEQIIGVLKEAEAGAKTAEMAGGTGCRKRRFTTGKPDMAGWRCRTRSGCGRSRTRTPS